MIKREQEITPTPEELADCLAQMNNFEQIKFLNRLAENLKSWDRHYCFQFQYITDGDDDNSLTNDARTLMQNIGEYAYKLECRS